jgi:hypothetical protein
MKFNLTNISTSDSKHGYAMRAILTIDGVDAGLFDDKGDGTAPDFHYINAALCEKLEAELSEFPPVYIEHYKMEIELDVAMFIDCLHYALVYNKEFKLLA